MNFKGIELCCPQCHGELRRPVTGEMVCQGCARRYPVVLDIPDLRIAPDPYIGIDEEYAKIEKLVARYADFDFEGFVEYYYSITSVVPVHHARAYTRGLLAGEQRARAWLEDWEAASAGAAGTPGGSRGALLEVGCGTGPLLVAAERYTPRAGVDIALRWLVVAKKRLERTRADLPLIAACAETLPFREPAFDRVVFDSALEHVRDQRKTLAEASRVLRSGGKVFAATPNRFSLGPDPQTGIWCGSWLPEGWTAAMVRRQGGIPPVRHLLSARELNRLLTEAGFSGVEVYLPHIPAAQRAGFPAPVRAMVSGYEVAARMPVSRAVLRRIGPLLHVVARKP